MVTFISDHLTVVGNDVTHDAFPNETLHDCHIHLGRRTLSCSDGANLPVNDLQKSSQTIAPLIEQLRPMNNDQGVGLSRSNHRGGSDRLSECGRRERTPIS